MQLLLGGKPELDVEEFKREVQYLGGYDSSSPQVGWLWKFLEQADQEQLSKVLSFITGCSCLPMDGLNPRFTVVKRVVDYDHDHDQDEKETTNSRAGAVEAINRSLPRLLPRLFNNHYDTFQNTYHDVICYYDSITLR